MTDETLSGSDRLIGAIMSLPSWAVQIQRARDFFSNDPRSYQLGALLSSLALATDDGEQALALQGNDGNALEWLTVVTRSGIVHARVSSDDGQGLQATVDCYSFAAVTALRVAARHNFLDGVGDRGRHDRMSFTVEFDGLSIDFARGYSSAAPLRGDDDMLAAFKAIRDGRR